MRVHDLDDLIVQIVHRDMEEPMHPPDTWSWDRSQSVDRSVTSPQFHDARSGISTSSRVQPPC